MFTPWRSTPIATLFERSPDNSVGLLRFWHETSLRFNSHCGRRPVRRILKRGVQSIASWPLGHGEREGAGSREAFTLWMI